LILRGRRAQGAGERAKAQMLTTTGGRTMTACRRERGRATSRAGRLRALWDRRSVSWHDHVETSDAFDLVRAAVLAEASPAPWLRAVDLGAGTGFLTVVLAPEVDHVLAVDVSPVMAASLAMRAADHGLENVHCVVRDLASFDLPDASVDLIVSSYALHHLRDADKVALAQRAVRWLRPGGRLVIADMMFGRGASRRDRQILALKLATMLKMGPGGPWRVAKNLVRFTFRVGADLPVPPEFWLDALHTAGFGDVRSRSIVAEAAVVTGVAP